MTDNFKSLKNIFSRLNSDRNNIPFYPSRSLQNILFAQRILIYGYGSGFNSLSVFILNKFSLNITAIMDQKFNNISYVNDVYYLPANTKNGNLTKNLSNNVNKFGPEEDVNFDLVIVSCGDLKEFSLIEKTLLALNYTNIIWALEIPEYHFTHTPINSIFSSSREILNSKHSIISCYDNLEDFESKQIFFDLLNFYSFGKFVQLRKRPISSQYIIQDAEIEIECKFRGFIDCGSHHGETIIQLLERGILGEFPSGGG